jgi:hypothetical protein
MLWIERLGDAPQRLDGPICWVAAHAEAAGWPLPPPSPDDLADAALARRDGGAPRLLRRRLLRALVARVHGLHPAEVSFTRDARGAPGLAGGLGFISMAGCRDWSAVALAPLPVGVDIEAPAEGGDLAAWTELEARQKAGRQGLGGPPPHARTWTRSAQDYVASVALLPVVTIVQQDAAGV